MHAMRGRALECLGHVAVAIGADHFGRYFVTGENSIQSFWGNKFYFIYLLQLYFVSSFKSLLPYFLTFKPCSLFYYSIEYRRDK